MNLVNKLFILFLVLIGFTNELVSKPSFYIDETKIIGTSLETNVDAYLGIPFAQPPVNDLRWKKTQSNQLSLYFEKWLNDLELHRQSHTYNEEF